MLSWLSLASWNPHNSNRHVISLSLIVIIIMFRRVTPSIALLFMNNIFRHLGLCFIQTSLNSWMYSEADKVKFNLFTQPDVFWNGWGYVQSIHTAGCWMYSEADEVTFNLFTQPDVFWNGWGYVQSIHTAGCILKQMRLNSIYSHSWMLDVFWSRWGYVQSIHNSRIVFWNGWGYVQSIHTAGCIL